jgi:tryptophan halogenase
MAVPDSLKLKMEMFRRHGRLMVESEELFKETSWLAVFMGQGIHPERYEPLTDAFDEQAMRQFMGNIRQAVAQAAQRMPMQQEFIARFCRAEPMAA